MQPTPDQRIGTILDGRYRLERLLGAGAMGAVFVALASNGGRYAVKLLLDPHGGAHNRELLGRFVREGKVTTQIRAPNVVEVYEFAVDKPTGSPFIVMQLLDGFDVDALVDRVGPVNPVIAVRIAIGAARGLGVAHGAGIIHRDIKPANLFLHRTSSSPDASGPTASDVITVKVADFGIAKALFAEAGDAMTATGSMLGSPLYMSPEQVKSAKHLDARSDVWSLGMALYTMLAGTPALGSAQSIAELMVSITSKSIPWLQDVAPWVDPKLAAVVHGALLGDVAARCPRMSDFIEGLTPFAEGTEAIHVGELAGVPSEVRGRVAPRGAAPRDWNDSVHTAPPEVAPDSTMAEVQSLVGTTLAGKYRLDRLLGHGGMGAVYEAATASGQRVAVKVVLEGDRRRPEMLRRFVREAKTTTAVESPNVVRVLDVDGDTSRGVPYIVMELLNGTDLDRLVRDRGALDPGVVCRLFLDACRGLSAAHARGVVHRDIKPANIFLHREPDETLIAKICDFGIAKTLQNDADMAGAASTELTRTGGMIGSPPYMSPEQAKSSKTVGLATDVWSLGIALYEALCGKRPFVCESIGELMVAIITQPVPPLQSVAPWIDPALADVVHHALQKDPALRYPTMEAFAQALYPFAEPKEGRLTATSLVPVADERRRNVARRSLGAGGTITHAVGASDIALPAPVSKSRAPMFVGIGLAALAVIGGGGFVLYKNMHSDTGNTAVAAKPPEADSTMTTTKPQAVDKDTVKDETPPPSPGTMVHAGVKITPPTATVTVNGKASVVKDGTVTLDGEPGDSFDLVAKVGDREVQKQVTLRKDGKPSIDALEVPVAGIGVAVGKPTPSKIDAGAPAVAVKDAGASKPPVAATTAAAPTTTSTAPVGVSTF